MVPVSLTLTQRVALRFQPSKAVLLWWQSLANSMVVNGAMETRFISNGWIGKASFRDQEMETARSSFNMKVCHVSAYSTDNPGLFFDGYLCVEKEFDHLYTLSCAVPESISHEAVARSIFQHGMSLENTIPTLNVYDLLHALHERCVFSDMHLMFRIYHGSSVLPALHLLLHDAMEQLPEYRVGLELLGLPFDFRVSKRDFENEDLMFDYWASLSYSLAWCLEQMKSSIEQRTSLEILNAL